MPSYHLLNVFTAPDGSHGNPLGVFLEGAGFAPDERQRIATELGYSETVFVDDVATGELHMFTPASELPLAGHPLVGTAWLIARDHGSCEMLRPPAGEVPTWQEDELRWIRARAEWAPQMELREYATSEEVEALDGPPDELGFVDCWAWIDEDAGVLRSRVFVADEGIPEDEATGAAALRIGAFLGRDFQIRQGKGSVLHVRQGPEGTIDVGGRVLYRGEHGYGD
ncbi:MAG TPA: PhzF family phenazine biosynthesis protein [Thermoleophilaceae bacterium]